MMRNLIKVFPIVIILLMLAACGKGKTNETNIAPKDTVKVDAPVGAQKVELKFVNKGIGKNDEPHNDIVLSIDGKDSVIAEILSCDTIEKVRFKEMGIPAEATTAIGGWWAGAGEYFYAYIKDGKAKVFYGWQSEEQTEEGYHWKEMDLTAKKFNHYNFTE